MSNYKVKVNNEAESKEVQGLFFKLGFAWLNTEKIYRDIGKNTHISSFKYSNVMDLGMGNGAINHKELTIQQLRDLVVLKRNSIDDATHIRGDGKKYFHAKSTDCFYQFSDDNEWLLSTWMNYQLLPQLKPIEKEEIKEYLKIYDDGSCVLMDGAGYSGQDNWHDVTGADWAYKNSRGKIIAMNGEIGDSFGRDLVWKRDKDEVMKEYLVPQDNGKYALTKATKKRVSDWVEVPNGADILTICETFVAFWKDGAVKLVGSDKDWNFKYDLTVSDYLDVWGEKATIAWKRHTQPEELPFVDDEPKSLNDTYAEIEQIRQDSINNPQHYNKGGVECIDAIEASMTPEAFKGYLKGNVQKYMWRYEHKGGKESLQKAQWYLNKLISKL